MQEEILKLYEKVQDKLSQEEFLAEMDQISKTNFKDVPFVDEVNLAREVLKNHGVSDFETIPAETDSSEDNDDEAFDTVESDDEVSFEMTEDLLEKYDKVEDKITDEEFLSRMAKFKKKKSRNQFIND